MQTILNIHMMLHSKELYDKYHVLLSYPPASITVLYATGTGTKTVTLSAVRVNDYALERVP